ncbi:MAG TPA: hypothetical protein VHG30_14670 [Microvirga sp.]|nr:hypothetical protein [Microvirga sp.]
MQQSSEKSPEKPDLSDAVAAEEKIVRLLPRHRSEPERLPEDDDDDDPGPAAA